MSNIEKDLCLLDELKTAHKLVVSGLGDLQEIDMGNDFYHLPHQSLASGIERLMKCYLCLVYEARQGAYPNFQYVKSLGHDLEYLKEKILREAFDSTGIPLIQEDYDFVNSDEQLKRIICILSDFGKFGRYYNLDVVTGTTGRPIDPTANWKALERDIEDPRPYLEPDAAESLYRDYYPRVHAKIIAKLERFIRAISMQFIHGGHGPKLRQYSVAFTPFITISNSKLGTNDYRRSVKILQKRRHTWVKRTDEELSASRWPKRKINKVEFDEEWPFRADEVLLECRDAIFCIVNIDGYDFALNGSASSRFNYHFPHDAGMAIIGKSVGPFIDMALELGKSNA